MNCSEFSALIDRCLDGELGAEERAAMLKHASECEDCRTQLTAAEQVRDILSHMDDQTAVPLTAQAAWRSAIRQEARRKRMKRIYGICSAAAAVCVLTVGVAAFLQSDRAGVSDMPAAVAHVEADGLSYDAGGASETMMFRSMDAAQGYVERTVLVSDVESACGYFRDIADEYGCRIERESTDSDGARFYVQAPAENASDFIHAIDHLAEEAQSVGFEVAAGADNVGFCVLIAEN